MDSKLRNKLSAERKNCETARAYTVLYPVAAV